MTGVSPISQSKYTMQTEEPSSLKEFVIWVTKIQRFISSGSAENLDDFQSLGQIPPKIDQSMAKEGELIAKIQVLAQQRKFEASLVQEINTVLQSLKTQYPNLIQIESPPTQRR